MFIDTVTSAFEFAEDEKLIDEIVTAMQQTGHRWHNTPLDRTPNKAEVKGMLTTIIHTLMGKMSDNPHKTHMNVGCGGINAHFMKWGSGNEEIRVFYAPVNTFRSVSASG